MARARGALPAPTSPCTIALSCSWALCVHSRESWWVLSNDGLKYFGGWCLILQQFYTSRTIHSYGEALSLYTSTHEKGESRGHVKRLGGSGGYRPCSASLRNKCIEALARMTGAAREEKLHTQVHRECIWVKYGLLQIKQKPQRSPKQSLLETRYYLFDTHPH